MQTQGLSGADAALDFARHADEQRRAFTEYLDGPGWTDCERYDCCLDTAAVGLDTAVDLVVALAESRVHTLSAGSRCQVAV